MTLTTGKIFEKIASLQSGGEKYFPPGLFPAYRTNSPAGYRRQDANLFFSVISVFTLQTISRYLTDPDQVSLVKSIREKAVASFPDFQNRDGLKTYNFWRTNPPEHFPGGCLLRHFDHFRLPDDADDTAMVYLTGSPTKEELFWLKEKLAAHANGTKRSIRNTYPEYSGLSAYSTWFGKDMYVEFDACVLSNVLYCLYHYKLPFNQHDHDSLMYIRSVIESGRYKSEPFRCAHHYPRTSLIIYHVARLIAEFDPLILKKIRPGLIETCQSLLEKDIHPMDRVLLSTSLLRFGIKPAPIDIGKYTNREFKGFWFFIAGLLTGLEKKWLYKAARSPLFHIHWECEAHCWVLLAEYAVLRQIN